MSGNDLCRNTVERLFEGRDLRLFKEVMVAELQSLQGHPSSLDGSMFLDAALADLEEGLDRLDREAEGR